jgi:hypothetical protein
MPSEGPETARRALSSLWIVRDAPPRAAGLFAAALPAFRAARLRIVDGLRRVV